MPPSRRPPWAFARNSSENEKRSRLGALTILAEEEGFPRRAARNALSLGASAFGRKPENSPLGCFLNGFPPHRFEPLLFVRDFPENEKRSRLGALTFLAEEEGFEPSLPGTLVKRFSRPPHSTTLPPLRMGLRPFRRRWLRALGPSSKKAACTAFLKRLRGFPRGL